MTDPHAPPRQAPRPGRDRASGSTRRRPFPKGRQLDPAALAEVEALLAGRPKRRDLLIEHLHVIQDRFGCLAARHLAALAHHLGLAQAEVYEAATFYAHFDVVKESDAPPPALTVRVCDSISCELAGSAALLKGLAASLGPGVRVVRAPCVGACDKAPVAVVGQRQVTRATTGSVAAVVRRGETRPVPPAYKDFAAYRAAGGYRILADLLAGKRTRDEVIQAVEASGLRGLGGAGFPTARKWKFLVGAPKPRILAVNADEGEPGTFKDRYCFETEPHRVIEGALIAAWAVEAEEIYVYLRDEYPQVRDLLAVEIAKVEAAGLARGARLVLRRGAGAYVCGEESSMLESIEGKRGLPRNRPPYPAQRGLFGRPTLINNVETLYWLPEILGRGPEWYATAGRPHFYSVSGRVKNPGVKRAPSTVTVRELIDAHSGGMADGHVFKGYLPGGASGGILPASMADLPLDFGALETHGCFVGSAAVVVLSDQDDIRAVVLNLMRFFEDESCGQCSPCRVGTEKMVHLLEAREWDVSLIKDLSEAMRDASICGLGQAAPNPVLAALRYFAADTRGPSR